MSFMLAMESLENTNKHILQLTEKLTHLSEELNSRERILSRLIEERNTLLQGISQETGQLSPDDSLPHYKYILPLVKEIHILELKVKEKQKEYENRKLHCEAARLGQAVLIDSFKEDECVLKRWSKELGELSSKAGSKGVEEVTTSASCVTNISYHAIVDQELLKEDLAFTVLCQGVHLRLQIKSETLCTNIHLPLCPASAKVGIKSDTYIPKLEDTVIDALSQGRHISDTVTFISQYIQDEMAPFVVIIPMKKRSKKLKQKSEIETSPEKLQEISKIETSAEKLKETSKIETSAEKLQETPNVETSPEKLQEGSEIETSAEKLEETSKIETYAEEMSKLETSPEKLNKTSKIETYAEKLKESSKIETSAEKLKETSKIEISAEEMSKLETSPEKLNKTSKTGTPLEKLQETSKLETSPENLHETSEIQFSPEKSQ